MHLNGAWWPSMRKLNGSQVVFSWPPATLQVIITARNHLSSASGKPSSCSLSSVNAPFVTSSPRRAGGFESGKGINTPVHSLHPRRAPSGLEDVASKMALPALLNVNGSNYSHVPATTCLLVTYQAQSTPHLNVAHCWCSQAIAALTSVNTLSLNKRHIAHSSAQQRYIVLVRGTRWCAFA